MRLLVTRPEPDARRTAARLAERGHEVVAAPLIEIRPTGDPVRERPVRAVLMTSANAARVMVGRAELAWLCRVPVFAVGAATAEAARAAGFDAVETAEGDAASLARFVRRRLVSGGGDLLHLSGRHVAADLAALLRPGGFEVHRTVVYETVGLPALPEAARAALAGGTLDGALVYSPRSARLLIHLVEKAGLMEPLARLGVYCLSSAVAVPFEAAGFTKVSIAASPDETALFASLAAPPVATARAKRV